MSTRTGVSPETVHVEVADSGHEVGHGSGHGAAAHGSRRDYLIGFGLAVALTAIPFWLVMGGVIPDARLTVLALAALAAVQIVVHMVYFLHMNTRAEGGWTAMALIFTLVVVVIALSGTLWVMYHLTANMMPGMPQDMRTMP